MPSLEEVRSRDPGSIKLDFRKLNSDLTERSRRARQRSLLSDVIANGVVDPHGFAAHAWALIGHACGAPGRGDDLVALDSVRLRLSCNQDREYCESVRKFESSHFFLQGG
jgi:hypothetical protein